MTIKQLEQQLRNYEQGAGVYSKYMKNVREEAMRTLGQNGLEITDKAVKQAEWKIITNDDMDITYGNQIGDNNKFNVIAKRVGFNKQEAQEFYDIFFKIAEIKRQISDLESVSQDSYYSKALENLEKQDSEIKNNN